MAKDILIVPGSSNIHFSGSAVNDIKLETQDSGSVAFTSNSGSILTLTNSFTGSLFSVGDVSGVPILDVNSDDTVTLGQFSSPLKIYTNTSSHTIISGSSTSTGSFGRLQATTISGNSPLNIEGTPNFTGNVLIGKTSSAFGTAGTEIFANGSMWVTKANGNPVGLNRTGGAGSVLEWYDDASIKGALGTATSYFLNNVGIGTATPSTSRRLHIHNTDDTRGIYVYNSSATSYAEIHMKANREFRIGTGGASSAAAAQNNFYIYDQTATAHRFTINSSGKVGIGETSPDKELHLKASEPTFRIEQTAEANKYFDMNVGTGGGTSKLKFSSEAQANTLVISNNARVGINQGSAAEALDVVGNGLISGNLTVGGTLTAQSFVTELTSTTILYDSGSTKFGNTSDDTHQMTGSLKVSGSLTLQNGFSLTPSTSNYALLGGWLNVGTIGLFSGTNGAHIYPNVGSEYGAWRMNGSRNGYGGISFEVGGHYNVLMSNATYMGFYDDTNNEWMLRGTVNGATYLYYNGTSKFETTSTGATVTGTDSNNTRLGISNTSSGDAFLLLDASNGDFAGSDYAYIKHENSTLDLVIASDSNAGKVRLISKNSNTMALDGSNVTIASTAAPNNSAKLGVAGNINVGNGQASSIVYFENSGTDMYIEGNANKLNIGSVGNTQRVTFPAGGGMHMNAGNVSGSSTSTGSFGGVYSAGVSRFIGNVGIGTNNPDTTLDIHGALTVDGNGGQAQLKMRADQGDGQAIYFTNAASGYEGAITYDNTGTTAEKMQFNVNQGTRMTILAGGNVGIGVAAPEVKLHVKETDSAFGNTTIHVENAKADDAGVIIIEGARTSLNDTGQLIFANSNSTVSAIKTFSGGGSNDHGDLRFYTSADGTGNAMTQQMTISTAGNVGIGTNNPGSKLEIWQGVGNGSSYDVIKIDGNTGNYGGMWMTGQWSAGQSGRIGFWGDSTSNKGVGLIGGAGTTPNLFVNASGKVGIGTTSPTSLLHVSASNASARVDGEGSNSALILNNNNAYWEIYNHHGGGGNLKFYSGGADRVTFATSGYVGIGSTSPYSALNVRGANTANGNAKRLVAFFDTTSAAAGTGAGISLGGYTNGTSGDINDLANIQGIKENGSAGNYASALTFQTRANGAGTAEQMRIASTGNIGIGDTSPTEGKLVVAGTGASSSPALHLSITESTTFNHFVNMVDSNLTAGENGIIVFGQELDTKNAAWIGYKHRSDHGNDNQLSLGFWGANNLVNILPSGRMGIGTEEPSQALHVVGNVAVGTGGIKILSANQLLEFGDSNVHIDRVGNSMNLHAYAGHIFTINGSTAMTIDNSGNIVMGSGYIQTSTVNASSKLTGHSGGLEVQSSLTDNGGIYVSDTNGDFVLQLYGSSHVRYGFLATEWGSWDLRKEVSGKLYLNNQTTYYLQPETTSHFNALTTAGNVDVGAGLDVTGNITVTGTVDGVDVAALSTAVSGKVSTTGAQTIAGVKTFSSNLTVGSGQIVTPSSTNLALNPNTGLVSVGGVIQTSGAGNNTMAGNLVVTGNITAKSFITQLTSILHQSGSTKFGDTKDDLHQFTGSVRISDAAPAAGYSGTQLLVGSGSQHHVAFIMNGAAYGTTPAGRKTILKLVNNATAYGAQYNNGIEFSPYHNKAYAGIYGYWHTDTGYYNLAFRTTSDGQNSNQVTAMTIDEGQRVGIGVTNPLNPLHVEKALNSDWIAKFKNTGTTNAYGLQIDTSANTGTGEFSLGVYTGTNSGFFVTSDAKVGIGTTAPTHQLSIYNSGAGTDMTIGKYAAGKTVGVLGTSADTSGYFQIQSYLSQGSTFGNIVLNAQGGNVGIGTATPARKLEVSSDTDTYVEIATTNAGADTWMYFRNDGDNNAATDFRMGRSNTGAFVLGGGSGATALYIDSSHNVGIGTVPSFPLSVGKNTNTSRVEIGTSGVTTWQSNVYSVLTVGVSGSHAITQDGSANSQQWFNIYDTGNKYRAYAGYGGNWMFTASTGTLAYRNTDTTSTAGSQITDLTAKFAIDKIGRVGIGTDTPVEAITIRGTSNGTDGFHYPAIAGYTTTTKLWALEQHFGDEGRLGLYHGGNLKVLMRASGSSYINNGATMNFGIGTASPSYKLDVSGTGRFAGDVTIGTGSDSRIKFVSGTSRAHIGPDQNVELRFGYANASDKNFYHNTTNVAKINGSGITVPSGNISGSSVSTGSFGRIDLHQGLYFNREAAGNAIFEGRAHYQSPFVKFDAYNRGRIAFGADVSGNTFFLVDGEMTHTWTGGELYGSYFNTKIWPNVDRNATIIRVQGEIERNSNSGTHGWFKGTDFKAPTVHNGTATVVNTATVFIDGAMSAGTTNNYSLYNASTADSYFGGKVGMGVTDLQYVSKLHLASTGHNIAMRISDSSLGIGLDFGYDDAGYTEAAIYNKYDSNDSSKITFGFGTALSTAPVMTLLKSGNLGLGTESPDYQLELEKAGGGFLSFKTTDTDLQNNDVLGTIQFAADDATASGIDIGAKIVATVTDNFQSAGSNVDAPTRLDFFTQDNTTTDVMSTVGATLTLGGDDQNAVFRGNVGIGIAVPTTKLHVYNLGTGLKVEAAGEAPYTQKIAEFKYLGNGNSLDIINIGGKASLNSDSGLLNLGTAGYARLTITSSGLVGIGVTPTAQLHVNGGAWNANMILQGGASESAITMMGSDGVVDGFVYANGGSIGFLDDDGNWAIQCKTDDYTAFHINNSEKMRITSAGNVGIGTTTPLSRLDVFEELTVTGVNGTEAHMRITDGRAGDVGNSYNLNRGARLGLGGHQGSGYAIFGAIDGRKYNSNINDQRGYLTFSVQAHEGGSWDLYEKMRINNDGNVGIGVTDPASFHGSYNNLVVGTGTGDNGITIYGASSGIAFADGTSGAATYAGTITYNHGVDKFYIGGSGNTQQVTIQGSNGNVGIGDTTPSYKLDVAGTGNFTGGLFLVGGNDTLNGSGANLGGAYDLYVGSQSSGKGSRIILNSGHTTGEFVMQARQGSGYSNGNIGFYRRTAVTTFSTLLHIGGDGKIGMGTESPDNNLHIFKGSAGTVTSDGNSQLTIEHSDHASLQFLTPNNKQQQILFGDPDDTDIGYINYNHNTNTMAFAIAAAVRMTILSGGQVGIGITNPGVALDVSGTIEATADVIAYASSDERLKENIKTIENPIEKVKQIRGVEFDWKEGNEDIHHNKGHDTGLIAQDVEKVVPEIVKDREDGYKGVRYEKLVGLLVESVKEQQKQIEELQSEIKELKDGSSK